MTSVKTANYMLYEQVEIYRGPQDTKVLPKGTFVSPIELRYVPQHVREGERTSIHKFDESQEVYCHTQFGIVAISRKYLRAT